MNQKEYNKQYYLDNKEKINKQHKEYYYKNKDKELKREKLYREKHKEETKQKNKDFYQKNKTRIDNYEKEWRIKNKINYLKKQRINQNKRYNSDVNFKIQMLLRNRLFCAIKENRKSKHTIELLGCSVEQLKQHLEQQFKPGMNWQNHGKWHIDHIKPCASFDLSKLEEQKKCFHYSNLQPLWAEENLKKRDAYKEALKCQQ
jgi:hypothetical protein